MMNPNSDHDMRRLGEAVRVARRQLQPYRENRYDAIRQYVGRHFSGDGAMERVPINMIELATNIYVNHLVGANPRALVTTKYEDYRPAAKTLSLAIEETIKRIKLKDALRTCVLEAIFSMGIMKVGIDVRVEMEVENRVVPVIHNFAEAVTLDDWVHDLEATTIRDASFYGNRYRVPVEFVMDNPDFDKTALEQVKPTPKTVYNEQGDMRASTITRGEYYDWDEHETMVELWDLYLPRENLMITVSSETSSFDSIGERPLKVMDWEGPPGGPYHFLRFQEVPDGSMPLPPVATWMDLHELANHLFRKSARQAERMKEILMVGSGGEEDGARIVEANDGEVIRVNSPELIKAIRFGGTDQGVLAMSQLARQLWSASAGNIDVLGGLAPQTDTVGQDQLLNKNANKRVEGMANQVLDLTADVVRSIAWWMWDDPIIDLPLQKNIGSGLSIPVRFKPETRRGRFLEYDIDIHPYSMEYKTPNQRIAQLMQIVQSILVPLMPMAQEQGISLNLEKLIRMIADYQDLPELEEILTFAARQEDIRRPEGERRKMAPVTRRINERISSKGQNPQQQSNDLVGQVGSNGSQTPSLQVA